MSKYLDSFIVRDKHFANNIFYAPMAGYSDMPFRQMCLAYNPGLVFCEMVKIEALIRHDTSSYKILDFNYNMHPIGAQLCGSNPRLARQAAKILEDLGVDWIDLNCGCPVDKVTKDGSGSAMLKTPELIGEMISEIRAAVDLPVSVKIRTGWDHHSINAVEILKIAETAGADVIIIHGRTRAQGYKGNADREIIKECKKNASRIKVFGNGDLFDHMAVKKMFDETCCDGVLLARGMVGQPWLVKNIEQHYRNESVNIGIDFIKNEMVRHFRLIVDYQIEKKATLDMRRLGACYLQRCEGVKKLKIAINAAKNPKEIFELVEGFDWKVATVRK